MSIFTFGKVTVLCSDLKHFPQLTHNRNYHPKGDVCNICSKQSAPLRKSRLLRNKKSVRIRSFSSRIDLPGALQAEIAILLKNYHEATEMIKSLEGKTQPRVDGKKSQFPATTPPISGVDSNISPVSQLDFLPGCWPRASIPIRHKLEDGLQVNAFPWTPKALLR